MKSGNLAKLFISIGLMAAIMIAIIIYSFAWFSSNNVSVKANSASFAATPGDTFFIDINTPDEEYERYMGETGIEYDGVDHPYYIIYSPFEIQMDLVTSSNDLCFVYKMLETSFVQLSTDSEPSQYLTEELLYSSFSMELHAIEYDEENEVYNETGENYRSENGYFRNISTGEIYQLKEGQSRLFSLYLFFQGDVGLRLLAETEADLDKKYTFVFSDPKYMYAYFELKSLFAMDKMHVLTFETIGWNLDDPAVYSIVSNEYNKLSTSSYYSYSYSVPTSGLSLEGLDGTAAVWPVAEVFDSPSMTRVATSVYFKEWVVRDIEKNENDPSDHGTFVYTTYRNTPTSSSSVKYLWIDPLREEREVLYATYGNSYEITLDYNDNSTDSSVAYIRPNTYYYSDGGHIHAEGSNINFYNPVASAEPSSTSSIELTDSFTIPTRSGYRFLGWSTDSENLVSPFTNNDFTPTSDVTLYCLWQRVINVTFSIPTTWGNNYATIDGIHVTNGTGASAINYTVSGGSLTLPIAKGSNAFTILSTYNATAIAHISSTNRNLTLKGWYYENNGSWVQLTSNTSFTLDEDVTVYAMWNERNTYSITLDLYQSFKPTSTSLGITYTITGRMSISSPKVLDGYTVLYNGTEYGTFTGSSNSNITVSNIPEGYTIADVLSNPTASSATGGYLASSYDFYCWTTTDNNWEGETLSTRKSKLAKVNGSTVINDAFIAGLTNNKLYVFFERDIL